MAKLDFIERRKIDQLIMMTADKGSGYVLDFTNATYQQFIIEKTGQNLYAKYGLSKGKNLSAIMTNENDAIAGKLLLEILRYMQSLNRVNDDNRDLFNECAVMGNRLIGRKAKGDTRIDELKPSQSMSSSFDYDKFLRELTALTNFTDTPQARGYEFEKYLNSLFTAARLEP